MAGNPTAEGYTALSLLPCYSDGEPMAKVPIEACFPPAAADAGTPGMPLPPHLSAQLGIAKALNIMGGMEQEVLSVEKTSCYGAWIVLSQVSRSVGWPGSLCALVFRSFIFLLLNYLTQTLFIYYIYDSQTNMNPFGSQMHLCDFGAHMADCPGGPNCHGPGGTEMPSPGDLYPYDIFNTRKFMRDSLKVLFPDMKDLIDDQVQPGEYGIESYYCRLLCVFVFVLQIADEFQNIRDLVWFLWKVPNEEALWVAFDSEAPPPEDDPHGQKELDNITFRVAGIPRRWKCFIIVFVLIPRIFIWRMLTLAGVHFLMETAAMVDQIVNTTALSFVLCTDELIHERLTTAATRHIVSSVEDLVLYEHKEPSNAEVLKQFRERELNWTPFKGSHKFPMVPYKLVWTVILMAIFLYEYYWHNCTNMEDGSSVSIPVRYPPDSHMSVPTFFLKFLSIMEHGNPNPAFWTMPDLSHYEEQIQN